MSNWSTLISKTYNNLDLLDMRLVLLRLNRISDFLTNHKCIVESLSEDADECKKDRKYNLLMVALYKQYLLLDYYIDIIENSAAQLRLMFYSGQGEKIEIESKLLLNKMKQDIDTLQYSLELSIERCKLILEELAENSEKLKYSKSIVEELKNTKMDAKVDEVYQEYCELENYTDNLLIPIKLGELSYEEFTEIQEKLIYLSKRFRLWEGKYRSLKAEYSEKILRESTYHYIAINSSRKLYDKLEFIKRHMYL